MYGHIIEKATNVLLDMHFTRVVAIKHIKYLTVEEFLNVVGASRNCRYRAEHRVTFYRVG